METWKAVIFLIGAGQGFMLSIALFVKGIKQEKASLFLSSILFVLALELLNDWAMQIQYHSRPNAFPFWNVQSYLMLPISLWFFIQLTTTHRYALKKTQLLVYLPVFLEIFIRSIWQIYWRFVDQHVPSLLAQPIWFIWTEILPIVCMFVVLGVYVRKLSILPLVGKPPRLDAIIGNYLRCYGMFTFLGALTLLWALGVLLKWPVFKEIEWLLTGCLFVLGYIGYIDPDFFTVSLLPGSTVKTVANPDFAQFTDEIELQRIRSAFRDDALHRQPKLTVDDVATFLHLPPRYISFLVNTRCATNFTTFVNQYRVDEVIQKLGDPKQQYKTILAIALEAGFNSKSSFNQVFKDHTGKAPSFYLRPTQNSSINHSA